MLQEIFGGVTTSLKIGFCALSSSRVLLETYNALLIQLIHYQIYTDLSNYKQLTIRCCSQLSIF